MGVLRFLLAFAVVVFHSGVPVFGMKTIPGNTCVELFFIISGFYMEMILSDHYARKRSFYLSRFFRLWPLFIVIALCYLVFQTGYELVAQKQYTVPDARINSRGNVWVETSVYFSNLLMVGQDIFSWFYLSPSGTPHFFYSTFMNGTDSNGVAWAGYLRWNEPAWSLGLEIWFYLLVPFLHRLRNVFLITLLLLSISLRILLIRTIDWHTYFFFPTQFYLFVLGMLAYRFRGWLQMNRRTFGFSYALLLAAIALYRYLPVPEYLLRFVILPVLLFWTINKMFVRFSKLKWDRFVGDLSYPVYITHSFVFLVLPRVLELLLPAMNSNFVTAACYAAVVSFSAMWVLKAEKKLNRFRWMLFKSKPAITALPQKGQPASRLLTKVKEDIVQQ